MLQESRDDVGGAGEVFYMPPPKGRWLLPALAAAVCIYALAIGTDKVKNEHAMTREYARQAAALERIAAAVERR